MSNLSQFFAGGGGGGFPIQFTSNASGTFVTPIAGDYLITAIGGGGGGGSGSNARGGGAGGLAQSLVSLAAGVTLTYTVGAAGAYANPGGTGGTTTVTGSGLTTLTANGGVGGNTTTASVGGTASGGNIMNVTGGSAGNVNNSGGGAVGVYGATPSATTATAGRSIGPFADTFVVTPGVFNGRLLQPTAGIIVAFDGTYRTSTPAPGQAGGNGVASNFTATGNVAGAFAGGLGGGQTTSFGGVFGGGGGGVSAAGGVGGVIIEYFLA